MAAKRSYGRASCLGFVQNLAGLRTGLLGGQGHPCIWGWGCVCLLGLLSLRSGQMYLEVMVADREAACQGRQDWVGYTKWSQGPARPPRGPAHAADTVSACPLCPCMPVPGSSCMSSSVTAMFSCKSFPGSAPSLTQEADWHHGPSPSLFLLDRSLEAAPFLIPHLPLGRQGVTPRVSESL